MIKDLKNIEDNSFGNKAYNLAKLMKAGFNVPIGFVIDRYFENQDSEIQDWYTKYNFKNHVSVRSSSNIEDSAHYSFAGQFRSFLNVTSENLLEKIREVANSANSEIVLNYLDRLKIDKTKVSVSIIIQEMVQPDFAGVAFTQNPVEKTEEIYIECVQGLGDKVVDGDVTPNMYTFSKNDLKNTNHVETFKVNLNLLRQYSEKFIEIEKLFGSAQDIEWASLDDKLWILQSRNITT